MKAKAAVYVGANQPFEIREYPLTAPQKGYAKMSLIASGVCGTDIHIHNGNLSFAGSQIIGHEFVGRIEEISESDANQYGLQAGDAVISDIACPCGECLLCRTGDDANCVNMKVTNGGNPEEAPHFHGGYGEYSYAPVENLIRVPESVNPKAAAVFACPGPTAIHAFSLAEQANCHLKTAKVAVVQGFGPVGSFALLYLAKMRVQKIVLIAGTMDEKKRALAYQLGATDIYDLRDDYECVIKKDILAMSEGLGADLVFEASGNPAAIPMGIDLLRNRGVYLVPGQYSNSGGIEIQPQLITFKALQIIGSSQYSMVDVRKYVEFLEKNPDLEEAILSLATAYRVEDVNQAFADAKARKNIKTLLTK
ncbi:MAG: hypothetical protein E7397_09120 [Ruminococcaceae bacterium]|nr:hypothetical protein [Oscillospiraceae bacterium]